MPGSPTPRLHQLCTQLLPCPARTAQEAAPLPVTRRSWCAPQGLPTRVEMPRTVLSQPSPLPLLGLRDHLQPKTLLEALGRHSPHEECGPKPSRCASILYPASTLDSPPRSPDSAPSPAPGLCLAEQSPLSPSTPICWVSRWPAGASALWPGSPPPSAGSRALSAC